MAVALAGALSSFLILRQAPVAPSAHMDELAEIRPLVQGEKLLFLGRDNFILYELRGSKPFTAVKNYYDPYYAQPNLELAEVFSKFDFDSVDGEHPGAFPLCADDARGLCQRTAAGIRGRRRDPDLRALAARRGRSLRAAAGGERRRSRRRRSLPGLAAASGRTGGGVRARPDRARGGAMDEHYGER